MREVQGPIADSRRAEGDEAGDEAERCEHDDQSAP